MTREFNDLARTLGGMPAESLLILVVLAGFGLAAYAIYAILSVTKGRH
jgi:hypothetical protein